MKVKNVGVIVILIGFVLVGFTGMLMAEGKDIEYSDPSGDVDNSGMGQDEVDSVDIVSISADLSADPYIFEITVVGLIDYTGERNNNLYVLYLDQVGDGDETVVIQVRLGEARFMGDAVRTVISGNGTNTLRMEVDETTIDGVNNPVQDIFAKASISSNPNLANDWCNRDYEGEDEEPDDDNGDDDTGDDDTGDDDTGDDDTGDDDTGDDDTGGEDDKKTPGFGLLLSVAAIASIVLITAIFFRRKR